MTCFTSLSEYVLKIESRTWSDVVDDEDSTSSDWSSLSVFAASLANFFCSVTPSTDSSGLCAGLLDDDDTGLLELPDLIGEFSSSTSLSDGEELPLPFTATFTHPSSASLEEIIVLAILSFSFDLSCSSGSDSACFRSLPVSSRWMPGLLDARVKLVDFGFLLEDFSLSSSSSATDCSGAAAGWRELVVTGALEDLQAKTNTYSDT
jgi:hypothetical protein